MCQLRDRVAAGKKIDSGVAVFGPGVDREMRLLDDHYARNTMWLKGLKDRRDDVCMGRFGSLIHQRFYTFEVIQYRRVAARVFNE